jgi:ribosome-binding protein aMBF1 (putative translation factor)
MKMNTKPKTCELCGREVPLTRHHSIPKQKRGKKGAVIYLCVPCHKQIHALFTNSELKKLNTVEKLKEDARVQKWIVWVRKKNPTDVKYHGKGGFHK